MFSQHCSQTIDVLLTVINSIKIGALKRTLITLYVLHRGSYKSSHVLLYLLNELRKRDIMRGLQSILHLFSNMLNKFNNTRA